MSRYSTLLPSKIIELDSDNKRRFYQTIIDPMIDKKDSDIYIITRAGDRLDLLAWKYYENAEYYFIILAANPGLRKDSLYLDAGIQLRIPVNVQEVLDQYNELNSSR